MKRPWEEIGSNTLLKKQRMLFEFANTNVLSQQWLPKVLGNGTLNFETTMLKMNSVDPLQQLEAVQIIRCLLSTETEPPIDTVIEKGFLPILVKLLNKNEHPLLQIEAAWAITNIAAGTSAHIRSVAKAGAISILLQMLLSSRIQVCEQALWALSNIIVDGPVLRDYVLQLDVVPYILWLVKPDKPITFLCNVSWFIINFCGNTFTPLPSRIIQKIMPAISILIRVMDTTVLVNSMQALRYLINYGIEQLQIVINSGIVAELIPLLLHTDAKVQMAAQKTVDNIGRYSNEPSLAKDSKLSCNSTRLPLEGNTLSASLSKTKGQKKIKIVNGKNKNKETGKQMQDRPVKNKLKIQLKTKITKKKETRGRKKLDPQEKKNNEISRNISKTIDRVVNEKKMNETKSEKIEDLKLHSEVNIEKTIKKHPKNTLSKVPKSKQQKEKNSKKPDSGLLASREVKNLTVAPTIPPIIDISQESSIHGSDCEILSEVYSNKPLTLSQKMLMPGVKV